MTRSQLILLGFPRAIIIALDLSPGPKARHRTGSRGSYAPDKADEQAISWQMRAAYRREPLAGPVALFVRFYRSDHRRVDTDNLVKRLKDAGNGIIYVDDSQVVEEHVYLERGSDHPRTEVAFWPIEVEPEVNLLD